MAGAAPRRATRHHLSDLAAQQQYVPGQGLRHLRLSAASAACRALRRSPSGLLLGVIESFTSFWFGPERAVTLSFALLLLLLFVRPSGLMGRRGYQ